MSKDKDELEETLIEANECFKKLRCKQIPEIKQVNYGNIAHKMYAKGYDIHLVTRIVLMAAEYEGARELMQMWEEEKEDPVEKVNIMLDLEKHVNDHFPPEHWKIFRSLQKGDKADVIDKIVRRNM